MLHSKSLPALYPTGWWKRFLGNGSCKYLTIEKGALNCPFRQGKAAQATVKEAARDVSLSAVRQKKNTRKAPAPGRQSAPHTTNEAVASRAEGLAGKTPDDKGEEGPDGQQREMAGSLGAAPVPEFGKARKGNVLPD
jgi:hypothetical protein